MDKAKPFCISKLEVWKATGVAVPTTTSARGGVNYLTPNRKERQLRRAEQRQLTPPTGQDS